MRRDKTNKRKRMGMWRDRIKITKGQLGWNDPISIMFVFIVVVPSVMNATHTHIYINLPSHRTESCTIWFYFCSFSHNHQECCRTSEPTEKKMPKNFDCWSIVYNFHCCCFAIVCTISQIFSQVKLNWVLRFGMRGGPVNFAFFRPLNNNLDILSFFTA